MKVAPLAQRADDRLFAFVARTDHGVLDRLIPSLTRAADHGMLWFGVAAVLAASGRSGRRVAIRGLASLAAASALTNGPAKWSTRRPRPELLDVPVARLLRQQPWTTSFPSGHSASAAAFATGVLLEAPLVGVPLAALAAGVAYGRVYTGVHYPSDVLAGVALGAAAAVGVGRLRPLVPGLSSSAEATSAPAPALPDGAGLVVVANAAAGARDAQAVARDLRAVLPRAEVVQCTAGDDLGDTLRAAAGRATALGVAGGDGTVCAAAEAAIAAGVPLAVLPAGTLNHFAADLGVNDIDAAADAVRRGAAVAVSVGIVDDGASRLFLNTFSLGVYPRLVRRRERRQRWLGKRLALTLALVEAFRHDEPLDVAIDGRRRRLWVLFVGNGRYGPSAFATAGRDQLDGDVLDVRILDAERRWARARVVAAVLTGRLHRSRVYTEQHVRELAVTVAEGVELTRDGEAEAAPPRFVLRCAPRRLTVYRTSRR